MSKIATAFESGAPADTTQAWLPPDDDDDYTVPLNLPGELARIGIGPQDRVIFERLPEGAALTIGECKPDGSWILLPDQLAEAEYIPLTHNGQTYVLQLSVLTEDPTDHGLPKTKARLQVAVRVPHARLPAFEAAPAPAAPATVIQLAADPALQAVAPATVIPLAAEPSPPPAPTPRSDLDLDKHFNVHAAEWQAHVRSELLAAERRLKAAQLEQLARMQTALARDESDRVTAIEANWKAELERRAAAAEARLQAPAADLTAARQAWEAEAAARLAEAHNAWRAEALAQRTALEAAWHKGEAERMAAAESRWRAEHEKRLEVVLANFGLLVRGQLGAVDGSLPLPVAPAASTTSLPTPTASATPPGVPERPAEAGDAAGRWRTIAAA